MMKRIVMAIVGLAAMVASAQSIRYEAAEMQLEERPIIATGVDDAEVPKAWLDSLGVVGADGSAERADFRMGTVQFSFAKWGQSQLVSQNGDSPS